MATTTELVAEIASTANASTYDFGAVTPAADSLLVVIARVSATVVCAVTDTGGVLTWTEQFGTRITNSTVIYTAPVGASPTSITIRVDCTGDPGTGCGATAYQVTGYNALDPVAQAGPLSSGAGGIAPSVNMAAARNTNNSYMAGAWNLSNPAALTPPSGWTEIADTGFNTPTTGVTGSFRDGGETSATITWGDTSATSWVVAAIEINDDSVGLLAADGAAAGSGAATGDGAATGATVGSAAGTATAAADGEAVGGGSDAASAGTSTVSGVGTALKATDATSAGAAAVSGVGSSTNAADGSAAGAAAVSGVGNSANAADAASAGAATVDGVSASIIAAVATASGVATAIAEGVALSNSGDGAAAGTATVSGAGAAIVAADGSAAGTATGSGASASLLATTGSSAGVGVAAGAGAAFMAATGTVAAIAATLGVGASTWAANGSSAGTATVNGEPFLSASHVRARKIVLLRRP